MFGKPRYTQNSLNLFFPRQATIRRQADMLERILESEYNPALVLPIPDDAEPENPRIVFSAKSGYSQIVINQVSIALTTQYSQDYQEDISRGKKYVLERVNPLFEMIAKLKTQLNYCGFSTVIQLPSLDENVTDGDIVGRIADLFFTNIKRDELHDLEFKATNVIDGKFYSNIAISNYRFWHTKTSALWEARVSTDEIAERGIQIVGDFNDRYIYNQKKNYRSGRELVTPIITNGIASATAALERIQGGL